MIKRIFLAVAATAAWSISGWAGDWCEGLGGATELHYAVCDKDVATVRSLIDTGADVNARIGRAGYLTESTPLHWATYGNSTEMTRILIAAGADVHAKLKNSVTPLHLAAARGSIENSSMLIEAGADVNATAIDGSTPLLQAVLGSGHKYIIREGADEVVSLLIEAGADVNAKYNDNDRINRGGAALHIAAYKSSGRTDYGHKESKRIASVKRGINFVSLLIDAGADVNAGDRDNTTPLHYAIGATAPLDVIRMLVDAGAKVNARNKNGRKPINALRRNVHESYRKSIEDVFSKATSKPQESRTLDIQ